MFYENYKKVKKSVKNLNFFYKKYIKKTFIFN